MAPVHAHKFDAAAEGTFQLSARPRVVRAGELRPLDVDMDALELGARDASDVTSSYLDTQNGEVLVIVKGEPDEKLLKDRVRAEKKRFKKIPAFGLAEERALLRDFLSRQMDGAGREFLMRLVDEPGAFHACLTTLKADGALWRLWERFEGQGLRVSLLAWLASLGLQPSLMLSAHMDD